MHNMAIVQTTDRSTVIEIDVTRSITSMKRKKKLQLRPNPRKNLLGTKILFVNQKRSKARGKIV